MALLSTCNTQYEIGFFLAHLSQLQPDALNSMDYSRSNARRIVYMIAGLIGRSCRRKQRFKAVLRVGAFFAVIAPHMLVCEEMPNSPPVRYRTAASILSLSPEEASHGEAARIRGVVTRSTDYGLVVQDRTAGIYIDCEHPQAFTSGDEIEVTGIIDPGQFAPMVKAQSIRKLGRAPLPRPKEVTFKQLSIGDEISQYVSITGEVRSAGLRPVGTGPERFWLQIAMADGFVYVSLPKENADAGSKLVDAVVRVNGAASSTRFRNRQMSAPTLFVAGMQSITVLRPPPRNLFALPLTPISRLMQYRSGTDYYHRVRVAGTVTYYKPGESLILEDGGRALFVTTAEAPDIKLGDRVEAIGFPAPRDSGPIVEDAVLRDIAPGQQLLPTPVTIADLSSGSFNYNLVSTEGRFLSRVQEPYREVLLLQDKSTLLLAELTEPENSNALQKLQDGSTIRISGISIVDITGTWNTGGPGGARFVTRCSFGRRTMCKSFSRPHGGRPCMLSISPRSWSPGAGISCPGRLWPHGEREAPGCHGRA